MSPPKFSDDTNFEGTEEWERSRIDLRELSDVCPVVVCKVEGPDLSSMERKQCYSTDRSIRVGDYI